MTLSKFTQQPTNKEVVDKINDVIDTMGSTSGANIDLSNLSVTGEAKFVSTSGDTMYGDLTIRSSAIPSIFTKNVAYDYSLTSAPSSDIIVGNITIKDTNDNTTGTLRTIHNSYNNLLTGIYVNRSVGGTQKTASVLAYVDASGNTHSQFSQTYCCDGQWISLGQTLLDDASLKNSSNTSVQKTVTLPNDGHKYEVLMTGEVTTGSTSGNYIKLQVATNQMGVMYVCGARTRSASTQGTRGSILTVASYGSNNVTITRNADFNGTATLIARAYRRIGTNT